MIGNRYNKNELPSKISLPQRAKNIAGCQYGKLTVDFPCGKASDGSVLWACKCSCSDGKYVLRSFSDLKRKGRHSCGSLEDNSEVMDDIKNKYRNELNNEIYGNLKIISYNKKINNHIFLLCECLKCGNIISIRKDSILNGHTTSCGCIHSKGEEIINKILLEKKCIFQREVIFPDLKDKTYLRFDFGLYNSNHQLLGLLEFQGKQHYQFENSGWNTKEHLLLTQKHDNMKSKYCEDKNIKLFIIKYNENIELRVKEIYNELYSK